MLETLDDFRCRDLDGACGNGTFIVSWEGQIALLSALDFACGSIFAAALASRVVVRDYGKDYASVLLLYPMNRKRMFRAKELLISLRTVLLCLPALLQWRGFAFQYSLLGFGSVSRQQDFLSD